MILTPRKITANRANARRATGPRTAAGKQRSSANATRHGLLARRVLLFDEDADRLEALRRGIVADLAPRGALEEALAERVVAAVWRLRRAERFETAAICHMAEEGARKREQSAAFGGEEPDFDEGQLVAMAMSARPLKHSITVSAVYTPPEHRQRGYATALVARLSQHLLDMGYEFINLFTDLENPTSNSIYQKIGYRPVIDFRSYRFSKK